LLSLIDMLSNAATRLVRRFGPYELGFKLGNGGMAEIYSGVRRGFGSFAKPVALKLMHPHLAERPELVQLFMTEAEIGSKLNHSNIVEVFDAGKINGRYYIAMELVRGITLADLIDGFRTCERKPSAAMIAYIARELCAALHHAHEQVSMEGLPLRIVHRDVTPHNIMLTLDGQVKLGDFGIARLRDVPGFTEPGTVRGTPEFVAPEQIETREVDRRIDVYGAGLSLFTFASAEAVYWRGTPEATLRAVLFEPMPRLSDFRRDLPVRLTSAIQRAAEKRPEDRFATAQDFALALPRSDSGAPSLSKMVAALYAHRPFRQWDHQHGADLAPVPANDNRSASGPAIGDAPTVAWQPRPSAAMPPPPPSDAAEE
jgi:serine/threonine protein kinase